VDHVVRDQPVATLHQIEDAFAFPDPRAAEEQQAHTEHIGERRVHGGRGREGLVQKGLEAAVELRGLESRPDHRDTLGARQLEQVGRRVLPLRDDDARQIELEERLEGPAARRGVQ